MGSHGRNFHFKIDLTKLTIPTAREVYGLSAFWQDEVSDEEFEDYRTTMIEFEALRARLLEEHG